MNLDNYSLEDVEEAIRIKQSRDSLLTFTEMTMPDYTSKNKLDTTYEAALHHKAICEALEKVERGEITRLIIMMPPRAGKLCADDTPVLTTKGWKNHGDLKSGDYVFGLDGKPTLVLAESSRGMADYEMEITNGEKIITHGNHEWFVYDRARGKERVLETEYLFKRRLHYGPKNKRGGRYVMQLPFRNELFFPEKELVMDPYSLGAWLGDGSAGKPCITHDHRETQVIEKIVSNGYGVSTVCKHKHTGVLTTYFSGPRPNVSGAMTLQLQKLGIYKNKKIPNIYKYSSIEQRLELLAGLVDTDGHVCPKTGRIIISTCNEVLRDDIIELVRTLGWNPYYSTAAPKLSTSGIQGKRDVYQIGFQPDRMLPCALERKAIFKQAVRRKIAIKSIKQVSPKPGKCIQVAAPDGIYLVGKKLIPTHNSELVSRRFTPWFLGKDRRRQVIFSTYNSEFAGEFGQTWREIMEEPRYKRIFPGVKPKSKNKSKFRLEIEKGNMAVAVGVGGSITGRGADLLLIDDPIKNRHEAESLLIRNNIWDWFSSTAYTRLMPGGRIVIVMTRWHEDDLLGRLLSTDYMSQEQINRWTILELPAIANENTDNEKALWPARYPLEVLKQTRDVVGPRDWNALYQQNPTPPEGAFFKRNMIEDYTYSMEELPDKSDLTFYTSFDLAVSKAKQRDATCCGTGGLDKNDVLWIMPQIYWEKRDADESIEMIGEHIIAYDPIAIYCEKGQLDKALGPFLEKYLAERKIYKYFEKLPTVGINKGARATSLRGRMQQGKVRWPRDAHWWPSAFDQMLKFTGSGDDKEDDFVDMVAQLGQGLHRQYHVNQSTTTVSNGIQVGTLAWVKQDANYRQQQAAMQRGRQGW